MNCIFIKLVYKIGIEDSFIYTEFGYWSIDQRLIDLRSTRVLSKHRRNLQGHQLVAAAVFMNNESDNNTDLDDYKFVRSLCPQYQWILISVSFSGTIRLIHFQKFLC